MRSTDQSALSLMLPQIVEEKVRTIIDRHQPAAGTALAELRIAAGLSQPQAGAIIGKQASTICTWERGTKPLPSKWDSLPALLNGFGVSQDIIVKAFGDECDGDLAYPLFVKGDHTMILYNYFLKHDAKVIQRLTLEAERGSYQHQKLYLEQSTYWKAEALSRQSSPVAVNQLPAARTTWLLQSADNVSEPDSAIVAKVDAPPDSIVTDTNSAVDSSGAVDSGAVDVDSSHATVSSATVDDDDVDDDERGL